MSKLPIFKTIFQADWNSLPLVIRKHYANRGHSSDKVTVDGTMKIEVSLFATLLSPFMRLTGALAPYSGENIPVTVSFDSEPNSNVFCLNRIFNYPNRLPYNFRSRMIPAGGNEVIEYMPIGIGWHAAYSFDGKKVLMKHIGYKIRIFGKVLAFPLEFILGRGYAEEEAISEDRFRMYMDISHTIFGKVYSYSGEFRVLEINLSE